MAFLSLSLIHVRPVMTMSRHPLAGSGGNISSFGSSCSSLPLPSPSSSSRSDQEDPSETAGEQTRDKALCGGDYWSRHWTNVSGEGEMEDGRKEGERGGRK